jgi:hypothetical protein
LSVDARLESLRGDKIAPNDWATAAARLLLLNLENIPLLRLLGLLLTLVRPVLLDPCAVLTDSPATPRADLQSA